MLSKAANASIDHLVLHSLPFEYAPTLVTCRRHSLLDLPSRLLERDGEYLCLAIIRAGEHDIPPLRGGAAEDGEVQDHILRHESRHAGM